MSIDQVVEGGYCVGCGACAAFKDNSIHMALDEFGLYKPVNYESIGAGGGLEKVCPFAAPLNENHIADMYFQSSESKHDERIGYYLSSSAGYVKEGTYREKGTSGGMITWIVSELLSLDLVDHVIHVVPANVEDDKCLFKYSVSSTDDAVSNGAKSRYYPIEVSGVIKHVQNNPGRYAFVGVPCFVKAIRLLMLEDERIRERIKFCIGLVCGHLKSAGFSENYAWQAGINPSKLKYIDFRVKRLGKSAGNYGVNVISEKKTQFRPTRSFFGFNWGYNFFRNPACNYCDDIFAETADMVVGDAWLSKFISDDRGTSLVIVRNKTLSKIIDEAVADDRLCMETLTLDEVIESQAGGIRDRREGLAVRLNQKLSEGNWAPRKRVPLDVDAVPEDLRNKYLEREKIGDKSHVVWLEAKQANDLKFFERKMLPSVIKFERNFLSWPKILRAVLKRRLVRFLPFLADRLY